MAGGLSIGYLACLEHHVKCNRKRKQSPTIIMVSYVESWLLER